MASLRQAQRVSVIDRQADNRDGRTRAAGRDPLVKHSESSLESEQPLNANGRDGSPTRPFCVTWGFRASYFLT
jgi:hypothetical protein